jgi:hypothetical protein
VRRREFLKTLPPLAASLALAPRFAFGAASRRFVVTSSFKTPQQSSDCGVLDLDARSIEHFSLGNQRAAHGYAQHPVHADRVVILDKLDDCASLVSVSERKVLHAIAPYKGANFYGHGAFSRDGKLFYSVEAKKDGSHDGFISIRDGTTLAYLDRMSAFGQAPHDIVVLEDRDVAVVGTGNDLHSSISAKSSLVWVDLKTHAKLKEISAPPGCRVSHLSRARGGAIFLSTLGAPRLLSGTAEAHNEVWDTAPSHALYTDGDSLRELAVSAEDFPKQRYGFSSTLSNDGRFFCVTYGPANAAVVYSTETKRAVRLVPFAFSPSALAALGDSGFLIGIGNGSAWELSAPGFEAKSFFSGTIVGSHALAITV